MEQREIYHHIKQVLGELLEDVDVGTLGPSTDLRDDLHIDSTMALEVAFLLGERLGRDIPFERWFVDARGDRDFTIQDLAVFLEEQIGLK